MRAQPTNASSWIYEPKVPPEITKAALVDLYGEKIIPLLTSLTPEGAIATLEKEARNNYAAQQLLARGKSN